MAHQFDSTEDGDSRTRTAVKEKADQVSAQARQASGSLKQQVTRQVDDRSTMLGDQMAAAADAIRDMGDRLRSDGNQLPARASDEAARRAEEVGRYLREADGRRILADVEGFGRRRPWLVAALGLAVGVAVGRLIKASPRGGAAEPSHAEPIPGRAPAFPEAPAPSAGHPAYAPRAVPPEAPV